MDKVAGSFVFGGFIISMFQQIWTLAWSLPFLFLRCIGIGYFIIKNDDKKVTEIIKNLEKHTKSTITLYEYGKKKPTGLFIGWKYIGMYHDVIHDREPKRELYLFTSVKIFNKLIEDTNEIEVVIDNEMQVRKDIEVYERMGAYWRLYYDKRKFNMTKYNANSNQDLIISQIKNIYKEKNRASIFISGQPGTGKSMIGFLLAKELNGKLCRSFNPSDPGDNMINLIKEVEPDEEKPLILMLDEANILIRKITDNLIIMHKNIPIAVHDKITFNRFMDDMIFYQNVILILTSNETKKTIDDIDISYLRDGRIDAVFNL